MSMKLGGKYRLVKHPNQPIGTLINWDPMTLYGTIEWDDKNLIPPYEEYPTTAFVDGTLVELDTRIYLGGDTGCWDHNWKRYIGFREEYDYCTKCDMKRSTNEN